MTISGAIKTRSIKPIWKYENNVLWIEQHIELTKGFYHNKHQWFIRFDELLTMYNLHDII